MVADDLEPNRRQAINNHYADPSMIKQHLSGTCIILRNMNIELRYNHETNNAQKMLRGRQPVDFFVTDRFVFSQW